jgi:predicted transcriptional regulator
LILGYERAATILKGGSSATRLAVLRSFADGRRSPVEVTHVLIRHDPQLNLGGIAYHVRKLEAAGLIEQTEIEAVRGTHRHLYKVTKDGRALIAFADKCGRES